jgi:hypothetical protein
MIVQTSIFEMPEIALIASELDFCWDFCALGWRLLAFDCCDDNFSYESDLIGINVFS